MNIRNKKLFLWIFKCDIHLPRHFVICRQGRTDIKNSTKNKIFNFQPCTRESFKTVTRALHEQKLKAISNNEHNVHRNLMSSVKAERNINLYFLLKGHKGNTYQPKKNECFKSFRHGDRQVTKNYLQVLSYFWRSESKGSKINKYLIGYIGISYLHI